MPRAPGSAARRSNRDWPPATPPASAHGAAADTPPPSTPVVERRPADRDGTTSGSSNMVGDDARRACPALVCLAPRVRIRPCGLSVPAAPTSPYPLLPHRSLAAHALTRPSGPLLASTGGSFLASVEVSRIASTTNAWIVTSVSMQWWASGRPGTGAGPPVVPSCRGLSLARVTARGSERRASGRACRRPPAPRALRSLAPSSGGAHPKGDGY